MYSIFAFFHLEYFSGYRVSFSSLIQNYLLKYKQIHANHLKIRKCEV